MPPVPIGRIGTIGHTAPTGTLIPTALTGPILALGATTTIRIATMGPTVPLMGGLLTALGGELGAKQRSCAGGINRSMKGRPGWVSCLACVKYDSQQRPAALMALEKRAPSLSLPHVSRGACDPIPRQRGLLSC
jgi:hypothetical protein